MSVAPRFDTVIHAATRIQLCAMLAEVDEADYSTLRDELGISDSVLSKHLKVLLEAGYLRVRSVTTDSRARKRIAMSRVGRRAYAAHVAELRRIIASGAE